MWQTIPKHQQHSLKTHILVRVDAERRRFIEDQAKRHNVTMSDVIRFLVDEKMKEQEK